MYFYYRFFQKFEQTVDVWPFQSRRYFGIMYARPFLGAFPRTKKGTRIGVEIRWTYTRNIRGAPTQSI